MASFTAYPLEDAIATGSFTAYPLEDDLLLGEYFVFGFAVFAGQKAVLARLVDLVDRVGDAIAGAEDVWRGVEALLIEEDERRLFDIATALCDFGIGEVGVEEQVLRLEESPLRDELAERKAREQLDGATQLACIDAKGLGQFFRFEDIGVQEHVDNWSHQNNRHLSAVSCSKWRLLLCGHVEKVYLLFGIMHLDGIRIEQVEDISGAEDGIAIGYDLLAPSAYHHYVRIVTFRVILDRLSCPDAPL